MFILVGLRLRRKRGSLCIGDEPERATAYRAWEFLHVGFFVVAAFAAGGWVLLKGPPGYPLPWVAAIDGLRVFATTGLVSTSVVVAAHLVKTKTAGSSLDGERAGHAFNALFFAAFACSLIH